MRVNCKSQSLAPCMYICNYVYACSGIVGGSGGSCVFPLTETVFRQRSIIAVLQNVIAGLQNVIAACVRL